MADADELPDTAENLAEKAVAAGAFRLVGIGGCARGDDRQRRRGLHPAGQLGGLSRAQHGQRGRARYAGEQRDSFLGPEGEHLETVLTQRSRGRPGGPIGAEHLADPGQRAERVRQRDDLARAARAVAGHGGDDALVQQIGQTLAQFRGHARVAGQEGAQPHGDESPHLGRIQPRRPPRRPGEQQVPLMGALLLLGEPDTR